MFCTIYFLNFVWNLINTNQFVFHLFPELLYSQLLKYNLKLSCHTENILFIWSSSRCVYWVYTENLNHKQLIGLFTTDSLIRHSRKIIGYIQDFIYTWAFPIVTCQSVLCSRSRYYWLRPQQDCSEWKVFLESLNCEHKSE